MQKRRFLYAILFLLIIPVGLATRKQPQWFFSFIADYGGDTLWATMFFLLFRFCWPAKPLWIIAVYTYSFSVAIEISQLYHSPWIDTIRHTFLGSMLLGFAFLWSDILCYLAGTIFGWLIGFCVDKLTGIKNTN